jgi:hypothetical protein
MNSAVGFAIEETYETRLDSWRCRECVQSGAGDDSLVTASRHAREWGHVTETDTRWKVTTVPSDTPGLTHEPGPAARRGKIVAPIRDAGTVDPVAAVMREDDGYGFSVAELSKLLCISYGRANNLLLSWQASGVLPTRKGPTRGAGGRHGIRVFGV